MMRKLLFIHVPKCAGLSMREEFPMPDGNPIEHSHGTLAEWQASFGDEFSSLRTITVVRHPCDRFVSAFSYLKQQTNAHPFWKHDEAERAALDGYATANEAALDCYKLWRLPHFIPQMYWGVDKCDIILRFEDLAKTMPNLPRLNASNHKRWEDALSLKAVDAIRKIYKEDFTKLNY